jgi:periplasmic divalent cation tolerance protein
MTEGADYIVVLSTVPSVDEARRIAHEVVIDRLAACVNLVTGIVSVYEWENEVREEPEVLLVMKTRGTLARRLTEKIIEIHPYDTPEVVALPVTDGSRAYFDWIESVTVSGETREESEQ